MEKSIKILERLIESKKPKKIQEPKARVLIFDIETSPLEAYVWRLWKTNVNLGQVINDWFIICWSAKWLDEDEVLGDCVTPEEAINKDDKRVVTSLWKLFDEADIVVAHNGNKFDVPKMNSKFIISGLQPPTPYYSVDTCNVSKKVFGFSSNKLDALATYFGFEHKLDTDFSLWEGCLKGNQESLDYMLKYNKQDVVLLEQVYLKLRPWIKNHPSMSTILKRPNICTVCGSSNIYLLEDKYYHTQVNSYPMYRCKECGALIRDRKPINKVKHSQIVCGH